MIQLLVFRLHIITSLYYSLRKRDHLQTNRLLMVRTYIIIIVPFKDLAIISVWIPRRNFRFPYDCKSHATVQSSAYFNVAMLVKRFYFRARDSAQDGVLSEKIVTSLRPVRSDRSFKPWRILYSEHTYFGMKKESGEQRESTFTNPETI